MTSPRTNCRSAAALGLALLAAAGCEAQDDGDTCRHGPGAIASVTVRRAYEEPYCSWCGSWSLWGEARVEAIAGEPGQFTLTLSFTEDATWITVDLSLPADAALPVAVGDEVLASASVDRPWWSNYSLSLSTRTGLLLLNAYTGGDTVREVPPGCGAPHWCGQVGYPDYVVQHPFGHWDPAAPWVHLRDGEEVVQVHRGVAYRTILGSAYTWTELTCSDMPQTELSRATLLVPLPVDSEP
jgi:hypothetical protein